MIILGIISIIFGALLYFSGNSINNDIDSQMESFFNYGTTNPGSDEESFGIILMVIGFALLIIGVFLAIRKKDEQEISVSKPKEPEETSKTKEKSKTCNNCGAVLEADCSFCMMCGASVSPTQEYAPRICRHCGKELPKNDAKFCSYCGVDILLAKHALLDDSIPTLITCAYEYLSSGKYVEAFDVLNHASKKEAYNPQILLGKLLCDLKVPNVDELENCTVDFGNNIYYKFLLSYADDELKEKLAAYQKKAAEREILLEKDRIYEHACSAMENLRDYDAIELFEKLGDWKNSIAYKEECIARTQERRDRAKKELAEKELKEKRKHILGTIVGIVLAIAFVLWFVISVIKAGANV